MQRLLTLLLSLLLLVSLVGCLAGCGEHTTLDPNSPVTLSFWHVYGEQADAPMNRLVAEFNASVGLEKGIVVTVTNVTNTSKIGGQLKSAMDGEPGAPEMPDLFSAHTAHAGLLGAEKLVDWNAWFDEKDLKKYVPEFIESGKTDAGLTIFPLSKSSYALFLNGTQFARFSADTGVTYDDLATWEGFFDAAAKYYEWSGGETFCAMDYLIRHVELNIQSMKGSPTFDFEQNGWFDMEDPAVYDSWMMFAKPLAMGHIAVAELYSNTHVTTGDMISGIGSTASILYYNDTVTYPDNTTEPLDLHVLPLPMSGGAVEYIPESGVGIASFKTTEQKAEAASVFVRWLTEGQRNLDFAVQTGYMPVCSDAYKEIESYDYPSSAYQSLFTAIQTMHERYTAVSRPDIEGFYAKTDILYEGLGQMQSALKERADNGEDVQVLAMETWEFFKSIE
ncbi:MAG: extracellular solute-binding protein [Clostridia bacterium]|nr:extracellular solute-binding protein [Clostridia bacterium]